MGVPTPSAISIPIDECVSFAGPYRFRFPWNLAIRGSRAGGREFVGDWRVTSRASYSPGEQGWFTLTKACEDGACVVEAGETRAS